jgi:hypothetical protein
MCHHVLWYEACQVDTRHRTGRTSKSQRQPKIGSRICETKRVGRKWVAWGRFKPISWYQDRKRARAHGLPRVWREKQSLEQQLRKQTTVRAEVGSLPGLPAGWSTGTASDDTELGRKMPDRCARACSRAALNTELRGEAHTRMGTSLMGDR